MPAGIIDFLPKILTHVRESGCGSAHTYPIALILVLIERAQNFTSGKYRSPREKQAISPETRLNRDTVEKAQKSGFINEHVCTLPPSRVGLRM